MQVAVRLRRETGMHNIDLALGEVGVDTIRQKVGKFLFCHDYTPKIVSDPRRRRRFLFIFLLYNAVSYLARAKNLLSPTVIYKSFVL